MALDQLLPRADGPESRLVEAMRYAVLGLERRVRPYLAIETARMLNVDERSVLRVACAVECAHAAGLVRDDPPPLAEQEERGGRAPVRRAYDGQTAILAGDALQSAAFEIVAHADTHPDPAIRCDLTRRLALALGARGAAGGRMLDLLGLGGDLQTVARMQRLKTGVLIAFAVEAPLALARAPDADRHALHGFAHDFSLAHQIIEDLQAVGQVDALGDASATSSRAPGTANLAILLGPRSAGERVRMLASQCRAHLDAFGSAAAYLRAGVDFMLDARA